jgi:hypothetical protein
MLPLHLSKLWCERMDSGLIPAPGSYVGFDFSPTDLPDMGLNPDYLMNHRNYIPIYGEVDVDPSPPPSREATPVPETIIWHELSFLDDHFEKLAGKWIMYSKKGVSRLGRDVCRVRILERGPDSSGPGYELLRIKGTPTSDPVWELVMNHKEFIPFYGSDKNHQRLWVIIEGKEAGRYCKAVRCPKQTKDSTEPIKFTVALADVKEIDGVSTTVIDADRVPVEVYSAHVAAIWQPDDVKNREPSVYVKHDEAREVKAAKR